jgi:hypothetical protein
MEEGVRLIARLSKRDEPNVQLALNQPLQVEFEPISTEIALPIFSMASR